MSSRVNTLKSLQLNDKHMDTAHFLPLSEHNGAATSEDDFNNDFDSRKLDYNRRQVLSSILESKFYKSSPNDNDDGDKENIISSPIEHIVEEREQTLSLNDI